MALLLWDYADHIRLHHMKVRFRLHATLYTGTSSCEGEEEGKEKSESISY
jgi:hypothetical protein